MDDVKVQLGIDIDALQRSATEATNILSKAFGQQQGLGANILGSGMPATNVPAQGKDTLRGVIDALERIERTLVTGFTAGAGMGFATALATNQMAQNGGSGAGGGQPLPGGGGGAGSGGGRGASTWNTPLVGAIGRLGGAIAGPLRDVINSGGYSGDVFKLVDAGLQPGLALAGALGAPALAALAPGAGIAMKYVGSEMDKKENFRDLQYEMWRSGGNRSMKRFTDEWVTDRFDTGPERMYGISQQESMNLRRSAERAGADTNAVLQLQGTLGQGEAGAGLSGALKRSGNKGDIDDMSKIFGAAISTGLTQNRFPEAMDAIQRAAESSVAANLDLQREISVMSFIGAGGAAYAPGSAKYGAMRAGIESMATNQSSPLAIIAALEQSGGNYATYQMKMQLGVGKKGGLDPKPLINAMWDHPDVVAWRRTITASNPDGDETLLNQAAQSLMFIGVSDNMPLIAQTLKDRARDTLSGPTAGQVQAGKEIITAPPPSAASSRARAATAKQQKGILSNFLGSIGYIQQVGDIPSSPQGRADEVDRQRASRSGFFGLQSWRDQMTSPSAVQGSDVTQAQIEASAQQYSVPSHLATDWINIESSRHLRGSNTASGTGWTARGYGQLSPDEMRSVGVTSDADVSRMSTDPVFSLDKSMQKIAQYYHRAQEQTKKLGWTDQVGTERLAKFHHGVSGPAETLVNSSHEKSWDDFSTAMTKAFTEALSHDSGAKKNHDQQVLDALRNANKIEVTTSPGLRVKPASPTNSAPPGQVGHK